MMEKILQISNNFKNIRKRTQQKPLKKFPSGISSTNIQLTTEESSRGVHIAVESKGNMMIFFRTSHAILYKNFKLVIKLDLNYNIWDCTLCGRNYFFATAKGELYLVKGRKVKKMPMIELEKSNRISFSISRIINSSPFLSLLAHKYAKSLLNLYKIDENTGNIISTKFYKDSWKIIDFRFLNKDKLGILVSSGEVKILKINFFSEEKKIKGILAIGRISYNGSVNSLNCIFSLERYLFTVDRNGRISALEFIEGEKELNFLDSYKTNLKSLYNLLLLGITGKWILILVNNWICPSIVKVVGFNLESKLFCDFGQDWNLEWEFYGVDACVVGDEVYLGDHSRNLMIVKFK